MGKRSSTLQAVTCTVFLSTCSLQAGHHLVTLAKGVDCCRQEASTCSLQVAEGKDVA